MLINISLVFIFAISIYLQGLIHKRWKKNNIESMENLKKTSHTMQNKLNEQWTTHTNLHRFIDYQAKTMNTLIDRISNQSKDLENNIYTIETLQLEIQKLKNKSNIDRQNLDELYDILDNKDEHIKYLQKLLHENNISYGDKE